jgi:hypothetical protein
VPPLNEMYGQFNFPSSIIFGSFSGKDIAVVDEYNPTIAAIVKTDVVARFMISSLLKND